MNLENKPDASLSAEAGQATKSTDWSEHEHVSDQVQLEAQKLVQLVGSAELAKNAIDAIEQPPSASPEIVKRNDRFLKALEAFETALATPVVSGELIDWATTANTACEQVGAILRGDVQRDHAAVYATIAKEDPELSSRVAKLRATDEQLSQVDFGTVQAGLKLLLERAQSAEQDELKAAPLRADATKQALAFVVNARTQETAIGTWFGEAFNRDRGTGD